MSLALLWSHTARVYRATTARDAYGEEVETWAAQGSVPTAHNCRPDQAWAGTLQDHGPGEQQAGKRVWYLDAALDVRERDVLDVTAGPEAPVTLRVLSVTKPAAPTVVHHQEANVEVWQGSLT